MAETTHLPAAELPPDSPPEPVPVGVKLITLGAILIPLLGVIAAPFLVWGWGFGWVDLGLLVGMYVLTAVGIGVGFHRLFVHRSFNTYTWVKFVWAVFGSMAVEGPLFYWAATHRRHHQYSDTPDDPHSPHHGGRGLLGTLKGVWHAHVGWFFKPAPPDVEAKYIPDLKQSPALRVASALFPVWVTIGFLMPAVLGGVISQSWAGVWTGLIWGGLVRVFLVHHVTWSVNSACHLWGGRPFHSSDESRNNVVFGILAMGEGWHNTHHAFPTSARHGLRWWQIDVNYWVIRGLALFGLGWDIKVPSKAAQERGRRVPRRSNG